MKRWSRWAALLATGALLAACNADTEETQTPDIEESETDETVDESAEEGVVEEPDESSGYQLVLDQARAQLDAEEYDAATTTLTDLLEQDLSDYPEIEAEANELLDEVHTRMAERAREVAGATEENSEFATIRQSSIYAQKFLEDTGIEITEASDEEIHAWFDENEVEADEPLEDEVGDESGSARFSTPEEAVDYAFDQTVERLDWNNTLDPETSQFFVSDIDEEGWVKIEVRQKQQTDEVEWSTMVGIYRFNLETDQLQRLDPITGEYVPA